MYTEPPKLPPEQKCSEATGFDTPPGEARSEPFAAPVLA